MNKAWGRERERDVLFKINTSAEFMGYKDISQKPEDEEDSKINETPYMCVGSSLPVEKIIKRVKNTD